MTVILSPLGALSHDDTLQRLLLDAALQSWVPDSQPQEPQREKFFINYPTAGILIQEHKTIDSSGKKLHHFNSLQRASPKACLIRITPVKILVISISDPHPLKLANTSPAACKFISEAFSSISSASYQLTTQAMFIWPAEVEPSLLLQLNSLASVHDVTHVKSPK